MRFDNCGCPKDWTACWMVSQSVAGAAVLGTNDEE